MNKVTEYTLNALVGCKRKGYLLCKSRDNRNIVQINKDNKKIFLGSKYSVERDINKIISDAKKIDDETIIVIFGLGAGEHILELKRLTKYNEILIIEPDADVIEAFKNTEYAKEILECDRIALSFYNDKIITGIFPAVIKDFNIGNIEIFIYANYDKVYEKEYASFMKKISGYCEMCIYNMNTQIIFSNNLVNGFFNNIINIANSTIINEIKDLYKGFPAIIVSGGPSLNKNINLLKEIQDKFVIIACSRTLKALLDIGVEPNFVCTVDPGDFSINFVEGLPKIGTKMVFSHASNPETIEMFKGKKLFFDSAINFHDTIENLTEQKIDKIWQGGSVAHSCMDLAKYIGCSQVIFIGQDLAYTDKKYHADIVDFSRSNTISEENNELFPVDDIYGNPVFTNKELNFYRKKFEEYIEFNPQITFINSTEGGANIKGTSIMPLIEAIKLMNTTELSKVLPIEHLKSLHKSFDSEVIVKNLKLMNKSLEIMKDKCNKGLHYSQNITSEYNGNMNGKVTKNFNKMKKISNDLEKIGVIKPLLEPIIYKLLINRALKFNSSDSEKQRIGKIKLQTEAIYVAAIQSINIVLPLIENTIKEVEKIITLV